MLIGRGMGNRAQAPTVASYATNIAGSAATAKTAQMPGTGTLPAGMLVIACAAWSGVSGCTASSLTDTAGNTWTIVQQTTSAGGTFPGCAIAWCVPTADIPRSNAGYTFTWTMSAAVTIFNAQFYVWEQPMWSAGGPPNVTAHGSATGNSTAVAIASAATVNVTGTRSGALFVACWTSTNTGTVGGSFTERYDGAVSTSRYYGGTRIDLAPGTAVAPAATIATAATAWAACSVSWSTARERQRVTTRFRSRPTIMAGRRY